MSAHTPNETTSTAKDNLEQLIYNIAEQARDEDYEQLYKSLVNRELFIPVEQSSLQSMPQHLKPGESLPADDNNTSIPICYAKGPRGESMVPVATQASSPRVGEAYVGIYWLEALAMVLKVESVSGILLQGKNSWICFYKPQIEHILKISEEKAEQTSAQG